MPGGFEAWSRERPAVLRGERGGGREPLSSHTLSYCLLIFVSMTTRVLQLLQELTACFGRVAQSDEEGRQAWELATEITKQPSICSVDGENAPLLRE